MFFKRLKSVLRLDGVRAKDPDLAQAYLLGKLLGALLLDDTTQQLVTYPALDLMNWDKPVSLWRLTTLCWETLASMIRGTLTVAMIQLALTRLRRYLSDGSRKRCSQWASAQRLLHSLSGC